MAAKREEGKEGAMSAGGPSGTAGSGSSSTAGSSQYRGQQQQAFSSSMDETKENIRKAIEEARHEIPRYTQAANDYQSQTLSAAEEMAESYLDSQKQVVNAIQSTFSQNMQQPWQGMMTMMSPQAMADMYSRMASSVADATIASTRMANNMMFANMEVTRATMNYARDNAREFSRVATNLASTFGDGGTAAMESHQSSSSSTTAAAGQRSSTQQGGESERERQRRS